MSIHSAVARVNIHIERGIIADRHPAGLGRAGKSHRALYCGFDSVLYGNLALHRHIDVALAQFVFKRAFEGGFELITRFGIRFLGVHLGKSSVNFIRRSNRFEVAVKLAAGGQTEAHDKSQSQADECFEKFFHLYNLLYIFFNYCIFLYSCRFAVNGANLNSCRKRSALP